MHRGCILAVASETLLDFSREITFDPENGAGGKIPVFKEEFEKIRAPVIVTRPARVFQPRNPAL